MINEEQRLVMGATCAWSPLFNNTAASTPHAEKSGLELVTVLINKAIVVFLAQFWIGQNPERI